MISVQALYDCVNTETALPWMTITSQFNQLLDLGRRRNDDFVRMKWVNDMKPALLVEVAKVLSETDDPSQRFLTFEEVLALYQNASIAPWTVAIDKTLVQRWT